MAYTNPDWAGDRDDMKSGYMAKQKVVTLSSAKAQFHGIAKGRTAIIWIHKLLLELHFLQKKACKFFNDNATISISENPVQHDLTKHVKIDRHFIKEKLEKKIIRIPFVFKPKGYADHQIAKTIIVSSPPPIHNAKASKYTSHILVS